MPYMNMSPSVIVAQVVLTVLLLAGPYAKSRFGYLMMVALSNVASLAVFVLNGDAAASLSLVLINLRSIAYLYQGRAKTDVIPFLCLIAQTVALIPSFSTSMLANPLSLLPMALTIYATAFMWWSKNLQHMRLHTAVNDLLWGVYDLTTGLPIAGFTDISSAVVSLSAYAVRKRTHADMDVPADAELPAGTVEQVA